MSEETKTEQSSNGGKPTDAVAGEDEHPRLHHAEEEYEEFRDSHWRVLAVSSGIIVLVSVVWLIISNS